MSNQEISNRAVATLNSNLYCRKATVDYNGDIPYLNLIGKRFRFVGKSNLTHYIIFIIFNCFVVFLFNHIVKIAA